MFIHTYCEYWNRGYVVAAFSASEALKLEIKKWCWQTYGSPGHQHLTAETRWLDNVKDGEVLFNNQEDLTLFVLKWS